MRASYVVRFTKTVRVWFANREHYLVFGNFLFEPFLLRKLSSLVPRCTVLLESFDYFRGARSVGLEIQNLTLAHLLCCALLASINISVVFAFGDILLIKIKLLKELFGHEGAWISNDLQFACVAINHLEAGIPRLANNLVQVDLALVHIEYFGGSSLDGLEATRVLQDKVVSNFY